MFIPYKVDVPMARYPIANWVLIAVTIIISLALLPALHEWEDQGKPEITIVNGEVVIQQSAPVDNAMKYFLLQPGNFHPAQLIGNLFAHAGYFHLFGNMLFLFVFGNAVNAKLGHWQFLLLYFGAGLCEGLIWLAIGPHIPALGASGAIMGIVGAMFLLYPLNEISVLYWFFGIYAGVWELSAGWVIALYFAMDIYGAVFQEHAGVGYLAHVAGFLTAAIAIAALLWFHLLPMDRGEKSLLQILKLMPHEDLPYDAGRPKITTPPIPQRRPTPPRPRDTGPISLD